MHMSNPLGTPTRKERFEELFEVHQSRLYSYVYALVRDANDAQDVFQQATTVLWKKFDEFEAGTNFFAWAATVSRYEALKFFEYRDRDDVYFAHDVMEQLAVDAEAIGNELVEARRMALGQCLKRLSEPDAKLVNIHYEHNLGSRQIAEVLGRSSASVCNSLRRIRELLLECIRRQMREEPLA